MLRPVELRRSEKPIESKERERAALVERVATLLRDTGEMALTDIGAAIAESGELIGKTESAICQQLRTVFREDVERDNGDTIRKENKSIVNKRGRSDMLILEKQLSN